MCKCDITIKLYVYLQLITMPIPFVNTLILVFYMWGNQILDWQAKINSSNVSLTSISIIHGSLKLILWSHNVNLTNLNIEELPDMHA